MNLCVILPAAGRSSRFSEGDGGEGLPPRSKLDEDMGGRPVLQRAVELFNARDDVGSIIVAGPADPETQAEFKLRHADRLSMLGATLVTGGETHRYETVRAALAHVPKDATHIAVHDAARPVTSQAVIERVFTAAGNHPAVIPVIDAADTIKRVDPEPVADAADADPLAAILGAPASGTTGGGLRRVTETLARTGLVLVQTPQVFEADLLRRAYAQKDLSSTDDAGLVERLGEPVLTVQGDPLNIKITTPADVQLARAIGGFTGPADRPTHKKF